MPFSYIAINKQMVQKKSFIFWFGDNEMVFIFWLQKWFWGHGNGFMGYRNGFLWGTEITFIRFRFDRNELRSPYESLAMFTRDYLPNNSEDVRARTQDARMFFQAMAGEMRFGVDPVPEFDFMQPILQKRWTINRCMKCFAVPGKENKSFLRTKIYHRNFFLLHLYHQLYLMTSRM